MTGDTNPSSTILDKYLDEIKNTPIEEWLAKALDDFTPEKLKKCVDEDINPFIEYFSSEYLSISPIKEAIRMRLHLDWNIIETYFLNSKTLKNTLISRYGENEAILKDNAGFIDDLCWKTYRYLRELVYQEREIICSTLKKHKKIDTNELTRELVEGESNLVNIPEEIFSYIIAELYDSGEIGINVEWHGSDGVES